MLNEKNLKISNNNGSKYEQEQLTHDDVTNGGLPEELTSLATENYNDHQMKHQSNSDDSGDTDSTVYSTDDSDSETECGWGPCSPSWIKMFASKQVFLAVFCMAWVLQGMYHTYFVSAITTIEKLFQIQSKITGIIMSATEMGQIGSSLLFTYYGGHGHRPKWIAWGMVLFAVSSFTCSLPHFIYGRQIITAGDLTGNIKEPNVCRVPNATMVGQSPYNRTFDFSTNVLLACEEEMNTSSHRIQPSVTNIVLAIFFISLLGVGMGQTAVYTLGIPYIDDNVASKESPLYFAITIGVRILGPAFGFIVGSLCTSLYADLSVDPKIDSSDPRWVGAWWLGLVLISGLLIIASLAMFAFPKRLPNAKHSPRPRRRVALTEKKNPSIRDFPKTVKRLLKNDILMFRTASSVLHLLPIAGLYTFLPKYLESQFRLPTPTANMISGVGGILVMGLGIVISGFFILRVKPNARFVAGWIAFTAIVYSMGMGILMFIGCPMSDLAGISTEHGFESIPRGSCNETACSCVKDKFEPICGQDGKTYMSPCHAGCQNYIEVEGKIIEYSDCMCLPPMNETDSQFSYGNATIGYCDLDCPNFKWYIILFSIFVFIHSTSEVGSMLLILRCVDPVDKAMALGLIQFAIGLFGNVPCPIIYGAVVDSACLIWKTACGEKGACGLYNADTFRKSYHGTTGALLLCAFFVDAIVWYKAGSINFVDEQAPFEEELTTIAIKIKSETD